MKNEKKQIPLTNEEIQLLISILRKTVPDVDKEDMVLDIKERLEIFLRL